MYGKNGRKLKSEYDEDKLESEESEVEDFAIIPPNGGWGWVVVISAFYCNVVVDGVQLTFGIFLKAISEEFQRSNAEIALAGSLMFGIHLLVGPVCSGFNAVFGLRPVTIVGCLICCVGVAVSYFATDNYFLYFSYGFVGGMGLGLVYMNTLMITTIYFTTYLPLAMGIVVCGTGVGTMVFAILGYSLLQVTTWRNSFLLQAALVGSMVFAAATFRPLKPVKVEISVEPNDDSSSSIGDQQDKPTTSKRTSVFLKDISKTRYISSSAEIFEDLWNQFVEKEVLNEVDKKCQCCECCNRCKIFQRKKKQEKVLILLEVKDDARKVSYISKASRSPPNDDLGLSTSLNSEENSTPPEVYKRVYLDKAITKVRGVALLKQTIITILDCHLLKSFAFTLFTICGAIQVSTLIIVYIYEKDRCKDLGFSEEMGIYFLVTLGGSNTFWRLLLGCLALLPKTNRVLSITGIVIGGIATLCSGFSKNVFYQFGFCFFFGMGMASVAVFRVVLLVDLVGWDLVSNATGINLMFMGISCIVCPPLLGWATEKTHNYDVIFCTSGSLLILSGLVQIGIPKLHQRELKKKQAAVIVNDT